MKCCERDQWQRDEARITEPVSVHSVRRLCKLTDTLQRGGVWEGRIDPERRGEREGGGRGVVGDHGVGG